MKSTLLTPVSSLKNSDKKLIALQDIQVDNTWGVGEHEFSILELDKSKKFKSIEGNIKLPMKFNVMWIVKRSHDGFIIHRNDSDQPFVIEATRNQNF